LRSWTADKKWADRYLPEIKRVVRKVAGDIIDVSVANASDDQCRATDYIVTVSSGEIACRVRRWQYWQKYGDLTFRHTRPSGMTTEVAKLQQGFARWYLYAWAKDDNTFGAWFFIDLDIARSHGIFDKKWPVTWNHDHSSAFIAISKEAFFNAGCVVSAGGEASDLDYRLPSGF